MYKKEFNSNINFLKKWTLEIIKHPTTETYKQVLKDWKLEGDFNRTLWTVINRAFAAADPVNVTSIVGQSYLNDIFKCLKNQYQLPMKPSKNWLIDNSNLLSIIYPFINQDWDIHIRNILLWRIYERISNGVAQKDVSSSVREEESKYMAATIQAQNIIFYGPPGTGKTYKLQGLLKKSYISVGAVIESLLWLNQQVEKLSWFEIVLLSILDLGSENSVAHIIKHKFFQAKLHVNGRESNFAQTAWAALQTHTITDSVTVKYNKRIEPLIFDKTQTSQWFIVDAKDEQLAEYQSLLTLLKSGPTQAESVKRYEFVTFHQSYGYEEFVEGLRPETNDNGDISYSVKPGVFKRICKLAQADPKNSYAIVIDEINRGNISKIFGELISLIEVDKRKGTENELVVTLPYSGELFCVPANLDIIGSMNTADRSLTHIDVALRRRFKFEELRTDYSLLSTDIEGVNIRRMLFSINQRIELLLDREHIIGHALLMKVDSLDELFIQFKTAILPLLEEYFFEDWEKISQVFSHNGFIQEQKDARSIWLDAKDEYAAKSYCVNLEILLTGEAYKKIYADIDDAAFALCDNAG
ncbi:restriction endonuclease [Shewanella sp. YLB-07]|nr:restriction endonuclease [Shewanella sp. YLB-07]